MKCFCSPLTVNKIYNKSMFSISTKWLYFTLFWIQKYCCEQSFLNIIFSLQCFNVATVKSKDSTVYGKIPAYFKITLEKVAKHACFLSYLCNAREKELSDKIWIAEHFPIDAFPHQFVSISSQVEDICVIKCF